jgi:hypothetical protein
VNREVLSPEEQVTLWRKLGLDVDVGSSPKQGGDTLEQPAASSGHSAGGRRIRAELRQETDAPAQVSPMTSASEKQSEHDDLEEPQENFPLKFLESLGSPIVDAFRSLISK